MECPSLLSRSSSNLAITGLDCTKELQTCSLSVKRHDTVEAVSEKVESFAPRPNGCLCLSFLVLEGSYVPPPVCGSLSPSVPFYHSSGKCYEYVACIAGVVVACASYLLDLVFAFTLPFTFLLRVDMHPVVIIRTCLFHFQLTRSEMLQSFGKNNTIATELCEERYFKRK